MHINTAELPISWTLDEHQHFCCQRSISNLLLVLDFSLKTTWGIFFGFVVKPQNGLVWPVFVFRKSVFQGILGTVLALELKIIFY